jgi:quercetin dioxygenase-like cupin family protein
VNTNSLIGTTEAAAIDLLGAVERSRAGIVSRTVLQAPGLRVVLFAFAEGQELTTHTNPRRAVVQILDGEGEIFFAGAWHRLGAGHLVHFPPHHPHAVRASAGPFSMLLTLGGDPGGTD